MLGNTMHIGTAAGAGLPLVAAVVWIGPERALVASRDTAGATDVREVRPRLEDPDDVSAYLRDIVDVLGAARRVIVLGADELRIDLEREFVAIGHHPERLADEGPAGEPDAAALLERLAAVVA